MITQDDYSRIYAAAEKQSSLSGGGAAEGAGERRSDVGGGYNLFRRFFGWHFFAGRR
jgi:hypothetical protein